MFSNATQMVRLEKMKNVEVLKTTTNRGEFNRAYKMHLEHQGRIRCSYCGYNRGENDTRKWYGTYTGKKKMRYPNWKLVSKNRKQWMKKPIKMEYDVGWRNNRTYVEIKW